MTVHDGQKRKSGPSEIEIYLRTGRRPARAPVVEAKYNPWHDPDDGRFTFANGGRYFPGPSTGRSGGESPFSPRHPRNHSTYVVRKGDTLTRIASARKGLRVADLADLNGISTTAPLRSGQRLIVPHQTYLDAARRAKDNFLNLAFYMDTHGGRLPPTPDRAPSIEEQLNSDWNRLTKNGYNFSLDVIQRPRRASGTLSLEDPS